MIEAYRDTIQWLSRGTRLLDRVHALEELPAAKCAAAATEERENYDALLCEIVKTIEKVEDNLLATILLYRYVKAESWNKMAKETGYSARHVQRLHLKALEAVDPFVAEILARS